MSSPRHFRQFVPRGQATVVLDEGKILAAERERALLDRLGLDSLEGALSFRGGELLRETPTRRTIRIADEGGALYLKVYRRSEASWFRRIFLTRPASPSRIEWENLLALRRSGFDVSDPIAMGEEPSIFHSKRSFLLTRAIPDGIPFDSLIRDRFHDQADKTAQKARPAAIKDLAGLIRRLHASGFAHGFLHAGHFIIAPDPRWGRPFLIDLRLVLRSHPVPKSRMVDDLAALLASLPSSVSRTDCLRFLLNYLGKSRVDPDLRRFERAIQRVGSRWARQGHRSR